MAKNSDFQGTLFGYLFFIYVVKEQDGNVFIILILLLQISFEYLHTYITTIIICKSCFNNIMG